jgi:transcriptional regulator with XRE-family HTH domain
MTPAQCRAARAMLNVKAADLAKLSGVSAKSLWSFENERSNLTRGNHELLQRALERLGVEFMAERDGVMRSTA